MSISRKNDVLPPVHRRRCAGHSRREHARRWAAVKRHGRRERREKEQGVITCQIFIEQRKGGTVWAPRQTLIADRIGNQVIIGHQSQHGYTGDRFATAGSAAEAAQQ